MSWLADFLFANPFPIATCRKRRKYRSDGALGGPQMRWLQGNELEVLSRLMDEKDPAQRITKAEILRGLRRFGGVEKPT